MKKNWKENSRITFDKNIRMLAILIIFSCICQSLEFPILFIFIAFIFLFNKLLCNPLNFYNIFIKFKINKYYKKFLNSFLRILPHYFSLSSFQHIVSGTHFAPGSLCSRTNDSGQTHPGPIGQSEKLFMRPSMGGVNTLKHEYWQSMAGALLLNTSPSEESHFSILLAIKFK